MIINGINYEVVITKKKIKKIYVRVKSDLKIYVNAPTKMPLNQIEKFLIECLPWLEKAIAKQKNNEILKNKPMLMGKYLNGSYSDNEIKKLLDKNQKYLEDIIKDVLSKLNINNVTVKYRYMKSRWGSCKYRERVITLNKYLIHFDEEIVKSVVCHEICHLFVPNHSKEFYNLLVRLDPYYKSNRAYLKKHAYVLK